MTAPRKRWALGPIWTGISSARPSRSARPPPKREKGTDPATKSSASVASAEGVAVHFLRTYHPYRHFTLYALDAWRMARLVRRLAPDVVHAHGTEAAYGHAALRSGLPFCITAQGLFFQILPTLGRAPTWNERFLRWGEDRVLRRTRHVIAKSEYVKAALEQQYPHLDLTLIPRANMRPNACALSARHWATGSSCTDGFPPGSCFRFWTVAVVLLPRRLKRCSGIS